jgi:uncharacterized protein YrzB (UPF0473 family)
MTDLREDVVTLLDEEGKEHSFMVLDIILVKESEYAIMVPTEDDLMESEDEEQEAVIFRIDETDGEQVLTVVEDDIEWEAVAEAWEEMNGLDDDDDEE